MIGEDDEFQVRPGRSRKDSRAQSFAGKVRGRVLRQGPAAGPSRGRYNRSGKGAALMRARSLSGGPRPSRGARRVIVKARIVKRLARPGAPAAGAWSSHLRYLQRDGVTPEGQKGQLYSAGEDQADGRAFLGRAAGDPHQFRFIVSAEDSADLTDLRAFTRDLMAQAERDLGVPLDWVAVDHFNTGHPHSHIVLRGRDRAGEPLFIAGDYIAHGLRQRASELATLELGPESVADLRRRLAGEVDQDRFTSSDRALLREAVDGQVEASSRSGSDGTLRQGRLRKLERLGLAVEHPKGRWTLAPDLEPTLRRLGERGDIIRALHRAAAAQGRAVGAEALALHETVPAEPVVGRLIGRRLVDELDDRLAVMVEGLDGRLHHLAGGDDVAELEAVPLGAIVAVGPPPSRAADTAIADLAARHGGIYHPSQHLADRMGQGGEDPEAFVQAHVRRLEALRRAGIVERLDTDAWRIPTDFTRRAAAYDAGRARQATLRVLSAMDLEAQIASDGATWLDRQLVRQGPAQTVNAGFGREVEAALESRTARHLVNGDATRSADDRLVFKPGLLAELQRRELARVGGEIAGATGLAFDQPAAGEGVDGVYRRRLQLASGAFALVEREQAFSLVPWRPVIEPHLGRAVSGVAQAGGGIDWRLGRSRGPEI